MRTGNAAGGGGAARPDPGEDRDAARCPPSDAGSAAACPPSGANRRSPRRPLSPTDRGGVPDGEPGTRVRYVHVPSQDPAAEASVVASSLLGAHHRGSGPLLVGVDGAGGDTAARADRLARALAASGGSVLLVLLDGPGDHPGVTEVARGAVPLVEAVSFEAGGRVARLGPGGDLADPAAALDQLVARLPRDVDTVVVTLPAAGSAARALLGGVLGCVVTAAGSDGVGDAGRLAGRTVVIVTADRGARRAGTAAPADGIDADISQVWAREDAAARDAPPAGHGVLEATPEQVWAATGHHRETDVTG